MEAQQEDRSLGVLTLVRCAPLPAFECTGRVHADVC